ncbi:Hypothetical_protein [Hexamita inflata]|uniref:Hypothetical_protein n=1 Tax=Hexamita inflata TaxID=28002 RepID=A0AA86NLX9_9EUKA|nr:Hypothetical protein HINF_LOCUS9307 [Hexamita inflata]
MADSIDIPHQIKLLEQQYNETKTRLTTATQQITKQNHISQLVEEEVNKIYVQLRLFQFQVGEFEMIQQIFFFDTNTFLEEGVTYDHIKQLYTFCQHMGPVLDSECKGLDQFMANANDNMKKERLALREEQLKNQNSAKEAEIDVENMMNDFAAEAMNGLADLKTQQLEANDILHSGENKMDQLQEATQENIKGVKQATGTVRKAMAALKRNKDLVFMGSALLMLAALILILIIS